MKSRLKGDALKRLRLLFVPAVLASFAALPAPAPADAATTSVGKGMMDAINWARADAGLRPLRRSKRLVGSSQSRAAVMMRNNVFAHPSRLRVAGFSRVGEVLEMHGGKRARMTRVLRRWGNSPAHREIIMSPRFRRIGAARATGRFNGTRTTMWVVRFGKK